MAKSMTAGAGQVQSIGPVPHAAAGRRWWMYHERVLDHFNNPRNVGSFDPDVGTGLLRPPACGDVIKLQITVDDATGKILDVCFKVFGCGSAIAAGSARISQNISPVKQHCSMLAEDAIKAAVKDYEAKRAKVNGS